MNLDEAVPDTLFPAAALYVVLMWVLAFRLGWLRRHGASEAPSTLEFLYGKLGFAAVGFLYSGRHRRLGDKTVSLLVVSCRILFVFLVGFFVYVIVAI